LVSEFRKYSCAVVFIENDKKIKTKTVNAVKFFMFVEIKIDYIL